MSNKKLSGVLLLLVMTSGCASMKVDVDIYKGPLSASPASLGQLARSVLSSSAFQPQARQNAYLKLLEELRPVYEGAINATSEGRSHPGAASTLWRDTKKNIDSAWQKVSERAQVVYSAAWALDQALIVPENNELYQQQLAALRNALAEHGAEYGAFQSQLASALRPPLSVLDQSRFFNLAETSLSGSGIAASAELTGRAVGHPIFSDRISGSVASRKNWVPFSSSTFTSEGGNSQFVIVREGLVVFRQKSLDFDPTPVIGAGTAMARLGLQVAAAVATGSSSVGNKAAANGNQGDAAAAQISKETLVNEAELESNKEFLERRSVARRELLLSLATLLEEVEAAEKQATDTKLKELRSRFDSVVNFFQGRTAKPEGAK